MKQLVNGMKGISSKGLIHRDLKPQNILIDKGILKITDFGLSKIFQEQTRTHTFKGGGTILYMSPEAWDYEKNTFQMDIYSMGVVFFQIATLELPYVVKNTGNPEMNWMEAHMTQAPRRSQDINQNITNNIAQIITKMLEKNTKKRYENWDLILSDLDKDNLPTTSVSKRIELIIKKRIDIDYQQEKLNEEETKELILKKQFIDKVIYQYENEIISTLTQLIEEINIKYTGKKIELRKKQDNIYSLVLPSGVKFNIEIEILFDEDFIREVHNNAYRNGVAQRVVRPTLNHKKILAWGYIGTSQNQGINFFLVENPNEMYGEFLVMETRNSAFSDDRRYPEPIALNFHELEEELQIVEFNATHQYVTTVKPFDNDILLNLLEDNI